MKLPNVVLLTLDTLRADMLGCYGRRPSVTPELDRLAARCIRFQNAITGGSWTQAAFPVLLTSTYASMYGGCLGPLSSERPSPLESLAASGYRTAAFSTSPLLSRKFGYDRGFDHFEDLVPGRTDPALRRVRGGQRLLRNPLTHRIAGALGRDLRPGRVYSSASQLTRQVLEWLQQTDGAQPYFLWAHYMDVHWPYHLQEELVDARASAGAWRDMAHLYEVNWHGAAVSPQQRAHYIALYERALAYLDGELGRLFRALAERDQAEDTLLIVVSDHGEEFLERKHWGHFETNLYDEILRVPLMIRLPNQHEGRIIESQVRLLDIMPTILELCHCPAPEGMEGTSLTPLWTGDERSYGGSLSISEMWRDERHIVAVRTDRFKYIWDSAHPDQPQLFDLRADTYEQRNLIDSETVLATGFQQKVDEHLRRTVASTGSAAVVEPELDLELRNRLRDLGYVR